MGLGISIEVQLIYYFITFIMFIITIFNMFKINKLTKINKDLDKESDDYKLNIKKIKKVFYISFIFIMIMEGIFCIFASMSSCNCGHYPVKLFPIIICLILTFIANIVIFKKLNDEDYKSSTLIVFIVLPIIIFIITVLLSKNEDIHNL